MSQKKPFIIEGKHVLIGFILFFGLIIGVNIAFVSLANKSFPGESVKHAYAKGVRYNETLAEREQAVALEWEISYSLSKQEKGDAQFVVKITDPNGPVDGLDVQMAVAWGGFPDADMTLDLVPAGDGVYRSQIDTSELPKGAARITGLAVRPSDGAKKIFMGEL